MYQVKQNKMIEVAVVFICSGLALSAVSRFTGMFIPGATLLGVANSVDTIYTFFLWFFWIPIIAGYALLGVYGFVRRKPLFAPSLPAPWPLSQVLTDFYLAFYGLFCVISTFISKSLVNAWVMNPGNASYYFMIQAYSFISIGTIVVWLVMQIVASVNLVASKNSMSGFSIAIVIVLAINVVSLLSLPFVSYIFLDTLSGFGFANDINRIANVILAILFGFLSETAFGLRAVWAWRQGKRYEQEIVSIQLLNTTQLFQPTPSQENLMPNS